MNNFFLHRRKIKRAKNAEEIKKMKKKKNKQTYIPAYAIYNFNKNMMPLKWKILLMYILKYFYTISIL